MHLHDRMRVEIDSSRRRGASAGVMIDVTDRKIAEQQMDQYLNLVERLAGGAVRVRPRPTSTTRSRSRCWRVNPAGAACSSSRAEDVIGVRFAELLTLDRVPSGS